MVVPGDEIEERSLLKRWPDLELMQQAYRL
jgi:hypothetical protein